MFDTARVTRWTIAAAIAMWSAVLINGLLADGGATVTGGFLGGDYPVFWTAGRLILDGRGPDIWDPIALARHAPDYFGAGPLSYPYPPHLAMLEVPLSLLPFQAAYVAHAALLGTAGAFAVRLMGMTNPLVARHRAGATAAALVLVPSFYGAVGGQATYLLVLIVVAATVLSLHERHVQASVVVAGLAYKPQFLLVPTAWMITRRVRPVVGVGALLGVVWYVVPVPWFGWDWPATWLADGIGIWEGYQLEANRGAALSLPAVARTAAPEWRALATAIAAMVSLAVVARTSVRWSALEPAERLGAIAALTALLSPHALYYELGLVLPALAAYADRRGRTSVAVLIAFWALSWLTLVRSWPINVATPLALWAWWLCVQPAATERGRWPDPLGKDQPRAQPDEPSDQQA